MTVPVCDPKTGRVLYYVPVIDTYRIQHAWKRHKESEKHNIQRLTQVTKSSDVNEDKPNSAAGGLKNDRKILNGQQLERRAHGSDSFVSGSSSDNASVDCHSHNTSYYHAKHHHNDTKTNDILSTSSASEVRLLASQVKLVLSQDDSGELEMFESPENNPFEGLNTRIASQTKALSSNTCTMTQSTHTQDHISQSLEVDYSQSSSKEVHGSSLSNLDRISSHNMHADQTMKDSSVKWIEHAFKTNTSHKHVPTTMKVLDKNNLGVDMEGIMAPEDRYRLCYTLELSDSSSDEETNEKQNSECINFTAVTGSARGNLEGNVFTNGPLHGNQCAIK